MNYSFRLLIDILDFSKIEARKLDLEIITVSPKYVLQKSVDPMLYSASDKGIKLKYSLSGEFPDAIKGDLTRIRQIVANLVSNAIKFTKEGEVNLVMLAQGETFQIRVKDSGIGMSKKQLEHIFESFSQADSTITRTHEGTGLGLTIAQRLVNMMGGNITVKSQLGKGSQFVVTLPLIEGKVENLIQDEESETTLMFDQAKDLIVDDNYINRKLGTEMLEAHGLIVSACVNGQEALEIVQKEIFDIVLMDIQMPVLNGLDATKAIRQLGGDFSTLPIIAMTAHATKEDAKRSLDAGLDEHITKPVSFKRLLNTFCRWLTPQKIPGNKSMPKIKISSMNLPWLETQKALNRLDNNEALLIQLLIDFSDSYQHASQQLSELLSDTVDFKSIPSLFHTIKGVSAGLGLIELSTLAARIETEAKANRQENMIELQKELDEKLSTSLETIEKIKSLNQPELKEKRAFELDELITQLSSLEAAIDTDFNLADETIKTLEEYQFDTENQATFEVIKNCWKEFDTVGMREALDGWSAELGED